MDNDPDREITVVNVRGRVVRIKKWMLRDLREQGAKVIVNPKQEYYPEFDIENQRYTPPTDNMIENIEPGQLLEVDAV